MTDETNNPKQAGQAPKGTAEAAPQQSSGEPTYEPAQEKKAFDANQDQEYVPTQPQSQEFGASPMSGGTESLMSFVKNQKAVAVVGGIVVLYILLSFFSGGDDDDEGIIVTPQSNPQDEMNMFEEAEQVVQTETTSLFASIDEMADETDKKAEDIDRLKTQVASLNRQNVDLRNRMDKLDTSVENMTKTLEKASMQLAALAKTQEQENKKEPEKKLQEYRIRAVISGRAWLEDGQGNNVTVKVGDNLPTYGRVTKIKPVEGIIETSSGRTITFSANE